MGSDAKCTPIQVIPDNLNILLRGPLSRIPAFIVINEANVCVCVLLYNLVIYNIAWMLSI